MFLASTMQSILTTAAKVAETLQVPEEYRDAVVKETLPGNFCVSIGEIHYGGSYVLFFEGKKLIKVYRETWTVDGGIFQSKIDLLKFKISV